ncbi:MAG TPA: hypothetical protein VFD32_09580 [Dehalococcoidia bacterium]|nr:hypothetical protein [Dehalococcoidia bacterium]
MFDLEYRVQKQLQYQEEVLYPRAARRQQALEELQRLNRRDGVSRRGPRRQLGGALIRSGLALATLGQWLQGRGREAPSPSG